MENKINITVVNKLLDEYDKYLYTIVFSFFKNHHDTEDALQDIKLKVYNSYDDNIVNFKFWSARIATNHSLDIIKSRNRRPEETDISKHDFYIKNENTPETIYLEKVNKENILKVIDELPEKYSEILKLFYFSELNYEKISLQLNLNKRTVETRIYRGRKLF